uniref:Retrotransposon gag domain-containing protein n=1 Tax=Photinus pyralis TaxID=7054 RepID=A0A1Y1L4P6_PHOPY
MDFNLDVDRLVKEELEYELQYRGLGYTGNVDMLRKSLRSALALEKSGKTFLEGPKFDEQLQIKTCDLKLTEVSELVKALETQSPPVKKIETKFAHIFGRINHITSVDKLIVAKRSELLDKLMEIISDYSTKCKQIHGSTPPLAPDFYNAPNTSQVTDNVTSEGSGSSTNLSKSIPVYKWNLKFAGNIKDSISFNSFLEKVEDLCTSRNVNKKQLFDSAIDLFEGEALVWFRMVRSQVSNWESLITLMKQEFRPSHTSDALWKQILQRTQGANESIGIYVAIMTNLFDRMPVSVPNELRLKVLRCNILPFYQERLVLLDIHSPLELIEYCRKLEETKMKISEFKPPQLGELSLEPDLEYHNSSASNRGLCFRCNKPGHFARSKYTCPSCNPNLGNGSRRQD